MVCFLFTFSSFQKIYIIINFQNSENTLPVERENGLLRSRYKLAVQFIN